MCTTEERKWTYGMYLTVLDKFPFEQQQLSHELGISMENLESRAKNLGVSRFTPPTDWEKEMYKRYHAKLGDAIVFLMPNRSISEMGESFCGA